LIRQRWLHSTAPKLSVQPESRIRADLAAENGPATSIINEVRGHVDRWRAWPNPAEWQVTAETARLLPDRDPLEIRFPRVAGYRVELPEERLTATFTEDSVMELTPDLVGATETQNSGIIGEKVDLNLVHTSEVRPSQVLYELTAHLVLTKWRDPGEDPSSICSASSNASPSSGHRLPTARVGRAPSTNSV